MKDSHTTHTKMLRVLELLRELTQLNRSHLSHIDKYSVAMSEDTIKHYFNRIDINTAIKERLNKYYNNRLEELNQLN